MSEPSRLVARTSAGCASAPSAGSAGAAPRSAWLRGSASLALGTLGFLLMTALLRACLPLYIAPSRTQDAYDHFAEDPDRYDTLFFGSSRVHFQVMPGAFDAHMRAQGHPTRSLNLGVYSMNGLSTEAFLEQILALGPRHLRFVWIDPGELAAPVKETQRGLERVVEWHDAAATWRALRWLSASEPIAVRRRQQARIHVESFAARQTGAGRARRWLAAQLLGRPDFAPARFDATHRGWDSLDARLRDPAHPRHAVGLRVRADFEASAARYEARVADLALVRTGLQPAARDRAGDIAMEPHARAYLQRLVEEVEAVGATPIFFVPPRLGREQEYLARAHASGTIATLFDYVDPGRYPELYERRHRFDAEHLNDRGSELFSAQLARDLAALLRRTRPPERAS